MKKIIIVGASSGIGKELSLLYLQKGNLVGITGRREKLLLELKNKYPSNCFLKKFDIRDSESNHKYLEELVKELGGVDILIISSGTGDINQELQFEIEKNTIFTNVLGFTNVADWGYKFFEKQKSGHIAVITSIAGLRGNRHAPSYNASKAYQINYLQGLQQKLIQSKSETTITDIRPGFVDTAMAKGEIKFWVATPGKAALQIYKAIHKKKKMVYITKRWALYAWILKQIPNWIYNKM